MTTYNLNHLEIDTDSSQKQALQDFSVTNRDNTVQVYFKNLESNLIKHIKSADIVVGCVAWLTSKPILEAMSKKKGVSIIVQKEDFLRPDINTRNGWESNLRNSYNRLPSSLSRYDTGLGGTVLQMMSFAGDPTIEAIRCVGNHNSDRQPAFPRSHHKFIVLCKYLENPPSENDWEIGGINYEPYEVWTGSFNFTQNATMSFENAVVLRDPEVVKSFFQEYAQIAALSEPLDWESNWIAPEWRIGT